MYIALGDDDGDQKMALKLLFQLLFVAKKGKNCLNYLFACVMGRNPWTRSSIIRIPEIISPHTRA